MFALGNPTQQEIDLYKNNNGVKNKQLKREIEIEKAVHILEVNSNFLYHDFKE